MKINILCLALISCLSISCSTSDESNTDKSNNSITGKWFYISEKFDGEENLSTDCDLQQYYEFSDNEDISVFYIDTAPCDFSQHNGKYNISENVLQLNNLSGSDNDNYTFTIITRNQTTLILEDKTTDPQETYRLELRKE